MSAAGVARRAIMVLAALAVHGCRHGAVIQDASSVSFCDLVAQSELHEQQVVRTTAILQVNPEERFLFEPSCSIGEQEVWVERAPEGGPSSSHGDIRRLNKLLRKDGRAVVTVVGRFQGPPKVQPPPEMTPAMAEYMRRANSRYGHMNRFRFRLEPLAIEEVRPSRAPAGRD